MERKRQKKATIYAVADRAGVAISTVSRVLNGSDDVSDGTRARVLQAIEELQFRPNRIAKSLAQRRKRTVAIAAPTFTTPYHNELLKGVRLCLQEHEVDVLLFDLNWHNKQRALLDLLKRGATDGLLLVGVEEDERIARELKALSAPVVHIGNPWQDFDCFYWDNVAGARGAVEHLIRQGHRRIGMITTHIGIELQTDRVRGYREALAAAGIPFDPSLVRAGATAKHAGFSEEAGFEAMQQLLEVDPSVTAVLASSDVQAIGAWRALRQAGKSVPRDVALVGYDDIKMSAYIGLSSVAQGMQDVGWRAAKVLLGRVLGTENGGRVAVQIVPRLYVRESSRYVVVGSQAPSYEERPSASYRPLAADTTPPPLAVP